MAGKTAHPTEASKALDEAGRQWARTAEYENLMAGVQSRGYPGLALRAAYIFGRRDALAAIEDENDRLSEALQRVQQSLMLGTAGSPRTTSPSHIRPADNGQRNVMQTGSWEKYHGRAVQSFSTLEPRTLIAASAERSLTVEFDYLGDRAEVWIVVQMGGVEIGRHNIKDVASISWPYEPA